MSTTLGFGFLSVRAVGETTQRRSALFADSFQPVCRYD